MNKRFNICNSSARLYGIKALVALLMTCALPISAIANESKPLVTQRFADATLLYQQGAFDRAIAEWRDVARDTQRNDPGLSVRANLGIAAACQKMGLYQEAQQALTNAHPLLAKLDLGVVAQYEQLTGNLYVAMHRHTEALALFVAAAGKAEQAKRMDLRAAIMNDYGNALVLSGYVTDAVTAYRQSLNAARELGLTPLALAALLNVARIQIEKDEIDAARATLRDAEAMLKDMSPSYEWAMSSLTAVSLEQRLETSVAGPSLDREVVRNRVERLRKVESYALSIGSVRLSSLVYVYQGQDLRTLGERESAAALLRKAVLYAAQDQSADVLYQAYWRLAQVLREQGKLDDSLASFDRALATLAPIRDELLNGHHDSHGFFQQQIRPVYAEYVDALFASADRLPSGNEQRPVIELARTVIETMTGAELQDYFRDECVVAQERRSMSPANVTQGVAVLYPIVLADRIELLLVVNGDVRRTTVPVEQSQVVESALRLREFIQDASHRRFLPYANRLYRWLIEPIKTELISEGISTLVVVPDNVLRAVPFAAVHSGERYLVEEFAIAVTPALKFTALPRAQPKDAKALLAGVAQSVQGFASLPKVTTELSSIHNYFGGRVITNHDYTKANLRAALAAENYSIVHMATHGIVGTTAADSFLLTYDDKLTMSDLESLLRIGEFRDRRVELLTLSACETAIGDERAALGLAGMAVKSGAASVVASLWLVDDEATATLMNRFYSNLQARVDVRLPIAKALRAAQLNLLADPATEHPANWAAFVLIGNWQ